MNNEFLIEKLKKEIKELNNIQKLLGFKNPSHKFLDPTINNAIASMVDLLVYLEGRNPYYKRVNNDFCNYRQTAMHRAFFSDLHIGVEEGLREIIENNNLVIAVSKQKHALTIVQKIRNKIPDTLTVSKELEEILQLAGNYPTFNDFLNTVLNGIASLKERYRIDCRIFFDGMNIIRNKVSHSDFKLSDQEKDKLKKAKLGKVIASDNNLQMTFEGYKLLLGDIIRFFDTLYASL